MKDWHGLLGWLMEQAKADPGVLADPFLKGWHNAALTETRPELPL
jgi:hypothetical protein